MAIEEVTDWVTPARDNKAHHPTSPQGRDPGRISLSFQELQAAIARWVGAGGTTYPRTDWTPVLEGTSAAGAGTYTQQTGKYTRIGDLIFVSCHLQWSAHTGTGAFRITGLPYTPSSNTLGGFPPLAVWSQNITFPAGEYLQAFFENSTDSIDLSTIPTGGNSAATALAVDGTGTLFCSGWYYTEDAA